MENPSITGQPKQTQKTRRRWTRCLRFRTRRRGTVIVDTSQGILVVSENGKIYELPGGAAKNAESQKDAALRELEEETTLKGKECAFLFEFTSRYQRDIKGGFFKDTHQVFLIKPDGGVGKPQNEVSHVAYTNGSSMRLSYATKQILKKYSEGRRV